MPYVIAPRQFAERAELYHQLAQLTAAGLPILRSLEQILRNPPDRSFRKPLQYLIDGIQKGGTFSEGLQGSHCFSEFDIALLEAGERSGRLDASLRLLAEYYDERARLTRDIISQMIYPVGLIHLAVIIFSVVVPYAFSQFRANLTWLLIRAVLIISPFYLATGFFILAGQSQHGENWRAIFERILRPIPLLGTARHYLALSRLAAALEALLNAGVNVMDAWELAATASGSPAFRRAVIPWRHEISSKGKMPSELVNDCSLFPAPFANLYASGEVSGKLDDSLLQLRRLYGEDGTRKLRTFAQLMPKVLYFIVAVVIGYFIIRFWQNYYGQISNITGGF